MNPWRTKFAGHARGFAWLGIRTLLLFSAAVIIFLVGLISERITLPTHRRDA